jgi:hypothetical protein
VFSRIAELECDVYVNRAVAARRGALNRDIARTVHGKAQWVRRKFWFLYTPLVSTTTGVGAASVAIAVEAVSRIAG